MEEFEKEEMIEEEAIAEEEYEADDYDEEEDYEESDDDYEEDYDEPRHSVLKWILGVSGLAALGGIAAHKIRNKNRIKRGLEPVDGPIAARKKRRMKKKEAELNAIIDGITLRIQANPELFLKVNEETEETEENED